MLLFSNRRHNDICSDNSELGALSHDLTDIIKYSCSDGTGWVTKCVCTCIMWGNVMLHPTQCQQSSQKEPGLTKYVLQGLSDSLSQRLISPRLGHAPWSPPSVPWWGKLVFYHHLTDHKGCPGFLTHLFSLRLAHWLCDFWLCINLHLWIQFKSDQRVKYKSLTWINDVVKGSLVTTANLHWHTEPWSVWALRRQLLGERLTWAGACFLSPVQG